MSEGATPGESPRVALFAGVGCYFIWGLVPLAFQAIGHLGATPWEILAHRTVWSVPAALALVLLAGQGRAVVAVFRTPRTLAWLTLSALLIAINWILFIGAVNSGHVLETSLGYYILPLVNMAAGAVIFQERIDRAGYVAIALAGAGVALQAYAIGQVPLISLVLAASFGGYGIVRKRVAAEAQTGLFVECALLAALGVVYVLWLQLSGAGHFFSSPAATAWLVFSGPLTAVPLALFAWAARRIPLSAMGFLQFIAPTISFVIGVMEGESFTPLRAAAFGLIWSGVAVFAHAAWRKRRPELVATAEAAPTS